AAAPRAISRASASRRQGSWSEASRDTSTSGFTWSWAAGSLIRREPVHKPRTASTPLRYGPAALEQLNEVAVIWAAEIRRAVRSARVITLLALYLMFTALVLLALAYAFHQVQQQIDDQITLHGATQEAIQPELDKLKQSFLGGVFGEDSELLESL